MLKREQFFFFFMFQSWQFQFLGLQCNQAEEQQLDIHTCEFLNSCSYCAMQQQANPEKATQEEPANFLLTAKQDWPQHNPTAATKPKKKRKEKNKTWHGKLKEKVVYL